MFHTSWLIACAGLKPDYIYFAVLICYGPYPGKFSRNKNVDGNKEVIHGTHQKKKEDNPMVVYLNKFKVSAFVSSLALGLRKMQGSLVCPYVFSIPLSLNRLGVLFLSHSQKSKFHLQPQLDQKEGILRLVFVVKFLPASLF